ncbi:hypothetical protein [Bradyrhizobium sp. ARR65]|uniref:hypothetical protein n=1 Tax=Bradyrhizobium sp. ARR65 TaxID=1040989 RepID=UPI000464E35F|nr:hypothetical protein [Bradyrhizobium sp. ARR65]
MKVALLSLALLGAELAIPVADRFPKLNVDALCKGRSAEDKAMRLSEVQSVADCIRDETAAREKLNTIWRGASGAVRNRCHSEAVALGSLSYLDLLTCLQMADDLKKPAPAIGSKAPSKDRTK